MALSKDEFWERWQQLAKEELQTPKRQIYMSFARPGEFLGAVIIYAHGPVTAHALAHELGLCPKESEVLFCDLEGELVPDEYCNRLLSAFEAQNLPLRKD